MIEQFEKMLAAGQDNALLRFGLGNAYLKANDPLRATEHLRAAVAHDVNYSAAWKLLGKALVKANQPEEAMSSYKQGIKTAEAKGDIQAAKEMRIFLKRLQKSAS